MSSCPLPVAGEGLACGDAGVAATEASGEGDGELSVVTPIIVPSTGSTGGAGEGGAGEGPTGDAGAGDAGAGDGSANGATGWTGEAGAEADGVTAATTWGAASGEASGEACENRLDEVLSVTATNASRDRPSAMRLRMRFCMG